MHTSNTTVWVRPIYITSEGDVSTIGTREIIVLFLVEGVLQSIVRREDVIYSFPLVLYTFLQHMIIAQYRKYIALRISAGNSHKNQDQPS